MTAKAVAALAAIPALAAFAWFVVPDRVTDRLVDRLWGRPRLLDARTAAQADGAQAAIAEAARGDAARAERVVEPAAPDLVGALLAPADLSAPGHVAFAVVDASGLSIENVRVKFLREKRFAEYEGGGDVDVILTSGSWDANVTANGFEPTPLASFAVEVGKTTRLGPVVLAHGSAVVEGRVVARHLARDVALTVQLFGDGRAPCDLCRPRPEVETLPACECGFRPELDELALTDERRFRFGNLAAGVYWLRAFDPAQRIVAALRIELPRGGNAWHEIDVTAPTIAKFELRHDPSGPGSRGGLFTGDWTTVHREEPAPITFQFRRDSKDVGEARIDPTVEYVRSSIGSPPLPQGGESADPSLEEWFNGKHAWGQILSGRVLQTITFDLGLIVDDHGNVVFGKKNAPERLDRERQENDALLFDCAEPGVSGAQLAVERLRADMFKVSPLPRELLTVVIRCGNYVSDELPLDLRFEQFAPLVVTMRPKPEWIESQKALSLRPPDSCTACHGEQIPEKVGLETNFVFTPDGNLEGVIQLGAGKPDER